MAGVETEYANGCCGLDCPFIDCSGGFTQQTAIQRKTAFDEGELAG